LKDKRIERVHDRFGEDLRSERTRHARMLREIGSLSLR
jgi:hypothetical protein